MKMGQSLQRPVCLPGIEIFTCEGCSNAVVGRPYPMRFLEGLLCGGQVTLRLQVGGKEQAGPGIALKQRLRFQSVCGILILRLLQ